VWKQGDEIWDGEDEDSPFPLGVLPLNMALDWELDRVEDEDSSLAIMDAFEDDFLRKVKVARPKTKGRREILNLVSTINYGDASASSRHRKGKAHVL
jgi:U3 small nucleolar ribonucleoprotein component